MNGKFAALACTLAFASPAMADTVIINDFSYLTPIVVTTVGPAYTGNAGQVTGLLNGNSFLSYCVEIPQALVVGTLFTDYTIVPGGVAFTTASKAVDLGKLLTWATNSGLPNNAVTSAGMQAAVWEVVYENGVLGYGTTTGTFMAASLDPGVALFMATIPWATIATTTSIYTIDKLASPTNQDLIRITAVPEAGTYAMMLAGLAGMGLVLRRRARAS